MVTKVIVFKASRDGRDLPEFTVDLSRLTEKQLQAAAHRGIMETIRNTWANIKSDDPKAMELSAEAGNEWIARLYSGDVWADGNPGTDGGGRRLSPLERELRVVLANYYHKSKGVKIGEAVKMAAGGRAVVDEMAKTRAEATGGDATAIADAAWAQFTALAQKRLDDANATKGMEL